MSKKETDWKNCNQKNVNFKDCLLCRKFDGIKCTKMDRVVGMNKDGWYVTAIISEKETKTLLENRGMNACPNCGRHLHMAIKGTSIGPLLYLVCTFCGWDKDITDYGCW